MGRPTTVNDQNNPYIPVVSAVNYGAAELGVARDLPVLGSRPAPSDRVRGNLSSSIYDLIAEQRDD
jgi:hypothetical protein